jgi:ACS family hexuronate transporter-like MFS transporter
MGTTKNYRWIIVVLLFTATTINYLDRQIIGLLKPILLAL